MEARRWYLGKSVGCGAGGDERIVEIVKPVMQGKWSEGNWSTKEARTDVCFGSGRREEDRRM